MGTSKIEKAQIYLRETISPEIDRISAEISALTIQLNKLREKRKSIVTGIHIASGVHVIRRSSKCITESEMRAALSAVMNFDDPMTINEIVNGLIPVFGHLSGLKARVKVRLGEWHSKNKFILRVGRNQYVLRR